MIKLRDAEIVDCLPQILGNQPWVEAISFATARMFQKIIELADLTRSYSAVDSLDDAVLDILAVDLRIVQYNQSFMVDVKRRMVKFALQYWATAGTVAATDEIVQQIFGDSQIEEWYEYGGRPGCFKVEFTDTEVTEIDAENFIKTVENVKRLSAWLDKIVMNLRTEHLDQYVGFFKMDSDTETTRQLRDPNAFWGFFNQETNFETYTMEE